MEENFVWKSEIPVTHSAVSTRLILLHFGLLLQNGCSTLLQLRPKPTWNALLHQKIFFTCLFILTQILPKLKCLGYLKTTVSPNRTVTKTLILNPKKANEKSANEHVSFLFYSL